MGAIDGIKWRMGGMWGNAVNIYEEKDKIERYRRQLEIYAHLVEEKTDYEVDRLNLYYTGEKEGSTFLSFKKKSSSIGHTIDEIDKVIKRIENKEFNIEEKEPADNQSPDADENQENDFSEDEMFDTVYKMMQDSERELNSKQILQILSSSGIVLNTFFHEFNAINTQFHVRASQIRSRVRHIL